MESFDRLGSMAELRQEIDALDNEIVLLLKKRADLIDRAAELKSRDGLPAHIESRITEVVENVRASAVRIGLDPDLAATVWRQLISWSVDREQAALGPDRELAQEVDG